MVKTRVTMVRTAQPTPLLRNGVAAAGPKSDKSQGVSVPIMGMNSGEEESQVETKEIHTN